MAKERFVFGQQPEVTKEYYQAHEQRQQLNRHKPEFESSEDFNYLVWIDHPGEKVPTIEGAAHSVWAEIIKLETIPVQEKTRRMVLFERIHAEITSHAQEVGLTPLLKSLLKLLSIPQLLSLKRIRPIKVDHNGATKEYKVAEELVNLLKESALAMEPPF